MQLSGSLLRIGTHRPEDHVKGHWNIKVKSIVVAHGDGEEHQDQIEVILQANTWRFAAALVSENEAFQGDERKLGEGDEVSTSRVMSVG